MGGKGYIGGVVGTLGTQLRQTERVRLVETHDFLTRQVSLHKNKCDPIPPHRDCQACSRMECASPPFVS